MNEYGIRGPLTQRKTKAVVDGKESEEASVDSGVPQCTLLGSLLFPYHINDLPDAVQSSVRLFADDCLLYRNINSQHDHTLLQRDLQNLEVWAKNWGMRFNSKKCYVLSIKNKSQKMYSLDGHVLQQVQHNPFLGLHISEDLKWTTHISKIVIYCVTVYCYAIV
ncbi:Hypothetical predicted protein [Mytilus galloprovincialis]|uniref:Reverse transcriptase domain-containing protein n=1 Tax=Mytilus galloprovincialis TaxID=29158 RepID=A0A8B6HMM9_MYTGA|nr:Hypothetical predicted protein [Mytilus galloprovincialis]